MLSCAVCSSELNGHYEFRPDSSPICISCHEADEREVRAALKTGRMPKLAPTNAIDALVGVPEVLPPESTGSIVCGPASGTQDIVIADDAPPRRSYKRVAMIAAGALATSALAIFALL